VAKTTRQLERYRRYARILDAMTDRRQFTLAEIRQACPGDHAALVSRVAKRLEQDGLVRRTGEASQSPFRWTAKRDEFSGSHWLDSVIYGAQIPASPKSDRPRERLLTRGAAELRTAELLAILIRSGRSGESALQAGEKIAARHAKQLEHLPEVGPGELKQVSSAVGPTAYCQIMAGIELGRRVAAAAKDSANRRKKIRSTSDALNFCADHFARLAADGRQEELHVVTLDTQLQVINTHRATIGLLDSNSLHPREIFRPAIRDAAKAIILVHNHPSGDPAASPADLEVTARLEQAAATVDIQLLDHIIVARNGAVSIQEHRQLIGP
jgi:DNA repair protein RadC